jgi:DNA-binding XRE family transcriptional regulator
VVRALPNRAPIHLVNRVRVERRAQGLTMEALAIKAGVALKSVKNIETVSGYAPSGTVMVKIAAALGLKVSDLFDSEPVS